MQLCRPIIAASLSTLLVLSPSGYLPAQSTKAGAATKPVASAPPMPESKRVVHLLNRLTFGPRPGDIEKVSAMGVEKWIEWQLNPQKIDDSALDARLQPLRTLKMHTREIVENYPPPQVLKAISEGRMQMPSDPKKRAVYEAQLSAYRARVEARNAQNDNDADMRPPTMEDADAPAGRQQARQAALPEIRKLLALPVEERVQAVLKMEPTERRTLVQAMAPQERLRLIAGMTPDQQEMLRALANPQGTVVNELVQAKLLRAIYSERQLEDVMADFWFNHFNVYIAKGADRYLTTAYERDTIRKHALGRFEDLLTATAKDPAMLFYLDNFQSVGPNSVAGRFSGSRMAQRAQARRRGIQGQPQVMLDDNAPPPAKRGLNENYARELMELHTLGVDGGYSQKDVTEVVRVFTGWTVRQPRQGGDYQFNPRLHEPGSKMVLGNKIDEGGESEGRKVLHLLATHPATARFISKKLAMRFVSDEPPAALVDRMAATFLKSEGDIKQVLRVLFGSPEFWAQDSYRAKVKTPLEFVVSAVRVTGAEVRNPVVLAQTLNRMGMPLFGAQPPTGYPMKSDAWVNSAALLNRMNFGLAVACGQLRGVRVDKQNALGTEAVPADPDAALQLLARALVAGDISQQTLATIRKQLDDPQFQSAPSDDPAMPLMRTSGDSLGVAAGLMLGSPEFQRR